MDKQFIHPQYRLFILGAGFSRPAGLPLSIQLLEYVRRDVRIGSLYHSGWDGVLEQDIKEWVKLYPNDRLDLERVLAYSHRKHFLRLSGSDEYVAHGSRSIVESRKAIQQILIDHSPPTTPSLYREFANHLTPNDTIMTFNYDTLMEQALDDIGKSYCLTPEWWLHREGPRSEPECVDVLKLHGSIDWYDREYHDSAIRFFRENNSCVSDRDPLFGPRPTVPTESLSKGQTKEPYGRSILPRIFRVPDHSTHFPLENKVFSLVVPFLLPLSHDKLLGHEPILDLWENLHRIQHDFSAIIIVGYSMPPHDTHAYETLGHICVEYQSTAMNRWERTRTPIQIITLADSDEEAIKNMPFLDRKRTRVWRNGFSEEALNWIDWGEGNH